MAISKPSATGRVSEAAILKSIMEYLAARHIFAMRMNSGTRFGEHKGKSWAIKMHEPGTADILAFPHSPKMKLADGTDWIAYSMVLWLEVKAADGKQSALQKSFQAQVEAEGHRYAVVRSIEDVEQALKQ